MWLFIAIIIVVCLVVGLISYRNRFVTLSERIRQAKSNVNMAKDKYTTVERKSLGMARKVLKDNVEAHRYIAGDRISSESLMALGQMYPQFSNSFQDSAATLLRLHGDYQAAQNILNSVISQYNTAVEMFPGKLFAFFLGFNRTELIGEEDLEEAMERKKTEEVEYDIDEPMFDK